MKELVSTKINKNKKSFSKKKFAIFVIKKIASFHRKRKRTQMKKK